jgi:hypothetical protein
MKVSDCVDVDEELERLCYREREDYVFRTESDTVIVKLNQLKRFFCTD